MRNRKVERKQVAEWGGERNLNGDRGERKALSVMTVSGQLFKPTKTKTINLTQTM